MDLKDIQTLIKFVSTAGVDEVSIEKKDFKISIKKQGISREVISMPQVPVQVATPVSNTPVSNETATPVIETAPSANTVEIKSPMIGTFYRSSTPDKPPFVKVGDKVAVGQAICIVEAMKLFNEIESEVSGTIVKVLVDDSSPVEYDQPLFLVEL